MTVIELVVAITLLGLVVAISGTVLGAVSTGGRSVQGATTEAATAGVAMNALRALFASAGSDEGRPVFHGDSSRARFMSYCADAMGDVTPCEVTVEASPELRSAGIASIDRWSARGPRIRVHGASIAYLQDQFPRQWTSRWQTAERVPTAMAVVAGRDTTFFRLGRP